MTRITIFLSGVLLALILAGCGSLSLAADVTPPPNYQPEPQSQPQAVQRSTAYPLLPPDPSNGKVIYAEKCLPCHGETGMGDGFQAGNLPAPPPAIGSAEIARAARPSDWYEVVTTGRLEKLMPGFSESLSDRQRWDVVAYVFSLSANLEDLSTGQAVYTAQCAACHGDAGQGDGMGVPDWTSQHRLAILSDMELQTIVADGLGTSMPAFAGELNDAEQRAVAAYIRTLTYAGSASVARQTQATPTSVEPTEAVESIEGGQTPDTIRALTIEGQITNPSGSAVPEGLKVTLIGFSGMEQVSETSTSSDANGRYEFREVEIVPGTAFIVQVEMNGATFNSDILHPADITSESASLPVTVYDTISDVSELSVDRMHVFFDFSVEGKVQVVELYIFANPTGKVIVPAAQNQPVLTFSLPEGATNIQFDAGSLGDRYVKTSDGFGDLAPIPPAPQQHQVLFSYDLPYGRSLELALPLPMPVNAAVVMLPPGGVKLESEQLFAAGSRDVQGMTFQLYTATDLAAGSALRVRLSGKATPGGTTASGDLTGLLIGLGAFGVVLVGAGIWIFRQRQSTAAPEENEVEETMESEDSLLDAILTLDDLYQAGKLPENAYLERRAELKERLKQLRESN